MKKYWSLLMALVLVLSVCVALVACETDKPSDETVLSDETLKAMITLIEEVNGTKQVAVETKSSFYVLGTVRQGANNAKVVWTVEGSEKVTLGEMDKDTYQIKVNIPHTDVAFSYTLVATIVNEKGEAYKDADGNAYSTKFVHTVPVTSAAQETKDIYNDSIIATVEAGKAYKMAMYCVADAKVYYFAGKNATSSSGSVQLHRLATTTDVKEAGDMYLEAVDGGYLLYFLDGTTKKYVETCEYVGTSYKDASLTTVETPTEGFKWTYDTEKQILVGPTTEETGEAFLAGYTSSKGVTTSDIAARKIEYFTKNDKNYAVHFVNAVEYTYDKFVKPETTKDIVDAVLALEENQKLAEGPYTLKGTVSKVTYEYSNGSMSFEMTLDDLPEQTVIVYRLTTDTDPEITVGTKVTVTGELQNYGGKPEFTNAKAVKEGGSVTPDPDPQPAGKEEFLAKIATSVEMNKEYYLAYWQGNGGKALYFKGALNSQGYYLDTVEDKASSVVVKFIAAENDGFYISFVDASGATKYVTAIVSGTHFNFSITDAKTTVFNWNTTFNGFTTVLGETTTYIGSRGAFTTISLSDITYISGDKASTIDDSNYIIHAIAKDGGTVTPDPDPQPETDEQKVAKAKAALEASSLTLTEANKELALPTYTGATLAWKLAEGEATLKLSEDGLKISATTLPTDADKTINITAEITIGTVKTTATVEVTVKKEVVVEPVGSVDAPKTVAEALAVEIASGAYTDSIWYVKGYVVGTVSYNSKYDNYTVTIADAKSGTTTFKIYGLKLNGNANGIYENDEIVASGYITNYQDKELEMTFKGDIDCQLEKYTAGKSKVAVTANENGTIEIEGNPTEVDNGTTLVIKVTAKEGYKIASVTANGKALEAVEGVYNYLVTEDVTIAAEIVAEGAATQQSVVKLTFPDDNKANNSNSAYTDTWTAKKDTFEWAISNCNNNKWGWTYIKCGRKNNDSVATISTTNVMVDAIDKVVVTIDKVTADKVNSIKLIVASDADYTKDLKEISLETIKAGDAIFNISDAYANCYLKLVFDCAAGSSNGLIQISAIEYFATK